MNNLITNSKAEDIYISTTFSESLSCLLVSGNELKDCIKLNVRLVSYLFTIKILPKQECNMLERVDKVRIQSRCTYGGINSGWGEGVSIV